MTGGWTSPKNKRAPATRVPSLGLSALHHHDCGDCYHGNHQHKRCETAPAAAAAASTSVTRRWWWGSRPPEAAAPRPRSGKATHAGPAESPWASWSWSESKHRLLLSSADCAPSLVVRLGTHFSLQLSPCRPPLRCLSPLLCCQLSMALGGGEYYSPIGSARCRSSDSSGASLGLRERGIP